MRLAGDTELTIRPWRQNGCPLLLSISRSRGRYRPPSPTQRLCFCGYEETPRLSMFAGIALVPD